MKRKPSVSSCSSSSDADSDDSDTDTSSSDEENVPEIAVEEEPIQQAIVYYCYDISKLMILF